MAATFDAAAAAESSGGAGATLSWTQTSAAGALLGIVAGISFNAGVVDITGVTWGGVAMVALLDVNSLEVFWLANPLTGAQTIVVTYDTSGVRRAAASCSVLGAKGANSRSTNTGTLAAGGTLTVALSDALVADLVVHAAALDSQGGGESGAVSFTEGETSRAAANTSGGNQNCSIAIGTKAGAGGSTNVGHSNGNRKETAALAVRYAAGVLNVGGFF